MNEEMRAKLWLSTIVYNKKDQFTITELKDELKEVGIYLNHLEIKLYLDSIVDKIRNGDKKLVRAK